MKSTIMIAATRSNSGKTTFTTGFLNAIKNKYSDNNNEISLSIVNNDRVKDILTDYYSNKINCSTKILI